MESKVRRLRRGHRDIHPSVPGILWFLRDLQTGTVFQIPIEVGIIVKMHVNTVAAGAIEISRERGEGALEIWGTAGDVVPLVANLVTTGRIEGQRITIAIERSVERHPRINSVVE